MIPEEIIKSPIITEKTSQEIASGKYTFKVDKKARKEEIKEAVEKIFNVKVLNVNTMNYEGKLKRQGRTEGRRPSFKKAIVQIATEQKPVVYLEKGGKEKKIEKKYKTEIEGFLGI